MNIQAWLANKFSCLWGHQKSIPTLPPSKSLTAADEEFDLLHRAIDACTTKPLPPSQEAWRQNWQRHPQSVDGLLYAARLSEWLGKTDLARHFLQRCLLINPTCASANSRLGIFLARERLWSEAIEYLSRAIDADNPNPLCSANLGAALFMAGEERDALTVLQKAWEDLPSHDSLARTLTYVAMRVANLTLAERVIKVASETLPLKASEKDREFAGGEIDLFVGDPALWPRVASAQLAAQRGDYATAISAYEAMRLDYPATTLAGLGTLAMARGNFAVAFNHFSESIATASVPTAQSYFNRAKALIALTRYAEALADFERALEIQPDHASARFEMGLTQLRLGNFASGWRNYEARRDCSPDNLFTFFDASAEWRGEALDGKSIILVGEQGQGDVIQFVRFAKILATQGAQVSVFCLPSLVSLIRTVPGVSQVFTTGETIPPYDYWTPMASVPYRVKLTLDNLEWNGPYVSPEPTIMAEWQQRLESSCRQPRIGIVWAGHDYQGQIWGQIYERRNLAFRDFEPLLEISGCSFFSLQKGKASEQLLCSPLKDRVADFSMEWSDFLDTAAFLANLDLVVTVDTSVAHLAGALEKPVWILSRTDGCWRWLDKREDSPWYPSARIFHQGVEESWKSVIGRVKVALEKWKEILTPETSNETGTHLACMPRTDRISVLNHFNVLVHGRHGHFLANRHDFYLGNALITYGEYGEEEWAYLSHLVAPGDTIVEVGANIGTHTVSLAKLVGKTGRIIAVEPQRIVFQYLCCNVSLNGLLNVETWHAGCGAARKFLSVPHIEYTSGKGNFGGVSLAADGGGDPVEVLPLDDLVKSRRPSLIKIDVEGMEGEVVAGAEKTIANCRPVLYVENDRVEKSASLIRQIQAIGYRLFWHVPRLFNPDNYFGESTNLYGDVASFNMVCFPIESDRFPKDLTEITDPDSHPLLP